MKYLILTSLLVLSMHSHAQNLVLNGNFDSIISQQNVIPMFWTLPTSNSPDYHHPARNDSRFSTPSNYAGFQNPKSGLSYFGLLAYKIPGFNIREYIQGQFESSLKKDSTYCFEIYISLADSVNYSLKNKLGVYLSSSKVDSSQLVHKLLHFNPQIEFVDSLHFTNKSNWVRYSSKYTAQGGESHLIIGNFKPDSLLDTLRVVGATNSMFNSSYYYIDDVWLSHCDSIPDSLTSIEQETLSKSLDVYPNPFKNSIVVQSQTSSKLNFVLYNSVGQSVSALRLRSALQQSNGKKYELDIGEIPTGLYWLRVSDGVREETVKLVKN